MKRWNLLLLLLVAYGGQLLHAQDQASVAERYLFRAANAERVQRGLPELRWDAALYHAALLHAREMATRASISHQYPGEPELAVRGQQAGAYFSLIAENVAEAPTAVRIHDAWMHSPGHRANLLDEHVDSIGISVVQRNGQLYAVQDFDRSVTRLTLEQQEGVLAGLVRGVADVAILTASDDARRTCAMQSGYAGRQPVFLMRFTTGSLERLPEALKTKLASGQYREASVAACSAGRADGAFTSYHLAVMLYP